MVRLRIRAALKARGISVKRFAVLAKLDQSSAWRALRPTANPTLKTLAKYARAIGCRVRDLISEK